MFKYIVIVIFLIDVSYGQLPKPGSCPENMDPMSGFNANQFAKGWYEMARTADYTEIGHKCIFTNVTVVNNGTMIFSIRGRNLINQAFEDYEEAKPNIGGNQFTVSSKFLGLMPHEYPLKILYTDYNNFALLYSCNQLFPFLYTEYMWIWQTDRFRDTAPAFEYLTRFGRFREDFYITNQAECVYH